MNYILLRIICITRLLRNSTKVNLKISFTSSHFI